MTDSAEGGGFARPYVSWPTFLGVVERMEPPGVIPTRIDRSFLKTYAGSTQPLILHAFRSLGLIERETGQVQDRLKALVNQPEERKRLVRELLSEHYPWALALDPNSTEQELRDAFRANAGLEGETQRKAIAFFLSACEYAGIPTSQLWKRSRGRPSGAAGAQKRPTTRRSAKKAGQDRHEETAGDRDQHGSNGRVLSAEEMRTAYFELLLHKAQEKEGLDGEIANRMEAVLGIKRAGADKSVPKESRRRPRSEPLPSPEGLNSAETKDE